MAERLVVASLVVHEHDGLAVVENGAHERRAERHVAPRHLGRSPVHHAHVRDERDVRLLLQPQRGRRGLAQAREVRCLAKIRRVRKYLPHVRVRDGLARIGEVDVREEAEHLLLRGGGPKRTERLWHKDKPPARLREGRIVRDLVGDVAFRVAFCELVAVVEARGEEHEVDFVRQEERHAAEYAAGHEAAEALPQALRTFPLELHYRTYLARHAPGRILEERLLRNAHRRARNARAQLPEAGVEHQLVAAVGEPLDVYQHVERAGLRRTLRTQRRSVGEEPGLAQGAVQVVPPRV